MPETMPVASGNLSTAQIDDLKKTAVQHSSLLEIQEKLAWIMKEMRESPPPPSEVAGLEATNRLIKVEMPPGGGVMTYMEGFDQPYQGFPFSDMVEKMDGVKKLTKGFKSGFYHLIFKKLKWWNKWLVLLFSYPFMRNYCKAEIYSCWRYLERFKIKPHYYCRVAREIYRAMSLPISEEEPYRVGVLRQQMRDVLCLHLEFDNAYRFRFQDAVVNLNKDNLKKDAVKEIKRILDLMIDREVRQEVKDSWILTRWMVEYLKFSKEIKPILISFLNNLDLKKCELAKEDWPYCKSREDYKFVNSNFNQKL